MKTWLLKKLRLTTVEQLSWISKGQGAQMFRIVLSSHTSDLTLKKNISFQFTFLMFCDECSPAAAQVRALCCWASDIERFSEKSRTAVIYSPVANPSPTLIWEGKLSLEWQENVLCNNLFSRRVICSHVRNGLEHFKIGISWYPSLHVSMWTLKFRRGQKRWAWTL